MLKAIVGRGYMNIKRKLSVLLVLCVVMVGSACQGTFAAQEAAQPQEQQRATVQHQVKQPKPKRQARKPSSKQWQMSSRGKRTLKGVGITAGVLLGVILAGPMIFAIVAGGVFFGAVAICG